MRNPKTNKLFEVFSITSEDSPLRNYPCIALDEGVELPKFVCLGGKHITFPENFIDVSEQEIEWEFVQYFLSDVINKALDGNPIIDKYNLSFKDKEGKLFEVGYLPDLPSLDADGEQKFPGVVLENGNELPDVFPIVNVFTYDNPNNKSTINYYLHSGKLKSLLSPRDYDKVRVALGLKPLIGNKIDMNVFANAAKNANATAEKVYNDSQVKKIQTQKLLKEKFDGNNKSIMN